LIIEHWEKIEFAFIVSISMQILQRLRDTPVMQYMHGMFLLAYTASLEYLRVSEVFA
jgi:hypothetical protein